MWHIKYVSHLFSVEQLPWEIRKFFKWRMSPITPNVVKNTINRSHFRPSKSKIILTIGTVVEHDIISVPSSTLWPVCFRIIKPVDSPTYGNYYDNTYTVIIFNLLATTRTDCVLLIYIEKIYLQYISKWLGNISRVLHT